MNEPLRVTLLRTVLIALVVGVVVGRAALWLPWTAFALWLSFGGHWVEVFFLNWLRPRLPVARWAQIGGRLLVWIVGGTVLMVGARATALSLGIPAMRVPPWALGGPIFVGLELVVHAIAQVRGRLAVLVLATLVVGAAATPRAPKPSVVLILMDDLGYGDLGSYGAPDVRTPNIDRLAREGVRLTDAYANGAVCTPTRTALITGRYQQRVGLEWALGATAGDLELGLPVTGTSLPALLKTNGYATGLVGKWHLGWKPEFWPIRHGFDEFYGFLSGAHDYYTSNTVDGPPDLYEDTTRVEPSGYLTDVISRRAVDFISRHKDTPFFLEVAYNAVHWPFEPPDRPPTEAERRTPRPLRQMPDDSVAATRQDYVRMLERADRGVGEILAVLERMGLTRNTLVIFTNDNGGEWLSRNAPLYHRKATLWEGGIRVPLILRWPSELPSGRTSGQVAITMDVTASILAATGTRTPEGYRPDGIDILPILKGEAPIRERQLFWRIARPNRRQQAVRSGRWKLLVDGGLYLLFDLGNDAGERIDLAAQHPDSVVSLKRQLAVWEADVGPVRAR